jgi:NitT/TauT family transport system substrate-binding protein
MSRELDADMTKNSFSRRTVVAGLAATSIGAVVSARGADLARIKVSVDYGLYGANAPVLFAQSGGFFRDGGIEAVVDGSSGSGDAINRVASGAYDVAYADIGTLAEFAARRPDVAPKLVMVVLDRTASAIVGLKAANITKFADLVGRRIGTGQSDATSRLFPALLKTNGLSLDQVKVVPVEQRLRDTMLLRGDVEAVIGFDSAILFNLKAQNVQPEATNVVYYADNGFDFYGNGLLVSRKMVETDPDLVGRITRAIAKAWIASIKDPVATIAALKAREPLTDVALETERLKWILSKNVVTAATRAHGFGYLDEKKMDAGLTTLATGFGLPAVPKASDLYDPRVLPPMADRMLPA